MQWPKRMRQATQRVAHPDDSPSTIFGQATSQRAHPWDSQRRHLLHFPQTWRISPPDAQRRETRRRNRAAAGFVACKRCPGRLSNSVVGATSISLLIYCAQNLANPDHRTKARLILGANCEGLWNAACQLYHRPHLEAVTRLASSHVPASRHVQRWRGARAHVPRRGGNCRRRQRACRACPGRCSGQHRYMQRWAVERLIPRRRAVGVPPLPAAHRVTLVPPAHVPCS